MRVNAELVVRLRMGRGWSQAELSDAAGLNLRTVQRIETTAVASLRSKRAIATALDIDIHDLDAHEIDGEETDADDPNHQDPNLQVPNHKVPNVQVPKDKEPHMSPCPHCGSDDVFESERLADTTTIGGELLPKLASGAFSSAKMRPVVCGACGLLRYFVDEAARAKLTTSKHWRRV